MKNGISLTSLLIITAAVIVLVIMGTVIYFSLQRKSPSNPQTVAQPKQASAIASQELVKVENDSYIFYHPQGYVQGKLVGPIFQAFEKPNTGNEPINISLYANSLYPTAKFNLEDVCQKMVDGDKKKGLQVAFGYIKDQSGKKINCILEESGSSGSPAVPVMAYQKVFSSPHEPDYLVVLAEDHDLHNHAEYVLLKKAVNMFTIK